jgi:hypothetical protein
MRLILLMALMMSFTALAQTRVRENIKQKAGVSSDDSSSGEVKVKPDRKKKR